MKTRHYITILIGAVLAVAPQVIPAIPKDYADIATAVVALLTAYYHLLQEAPSGN